MTVILRRFFNMVYTSPDNSVTIVHIGGAVVSKTQGQPADVMVK